MGTLSVVQAETQAKLQTRPREAAQRLRTLKNPSVYWGWLSKAFRISSELHGNEALVPTTGLEPVRCYSLEPESSASANSATWATPTTNSVMTVSGTRLFSDFSRGACESDDPKLAHRQSATASGLTGHPPLRVARWILSRRTTRATEQFGWSCEGLVPNSGHEVFPCDLPGGHRAAVGFC